LANYHPSKSTVVVAMSGGVDSSVAAAILVEQGYRVVGMMMRLWSEEPLTGVKHNRCCTPEQVADAERIANDLGIPFYVIDTKSTFRNTVVQYFIDQHSEGNTPNPCIECNRQIRFKFLLNHALALGADFLATGHYAQIQHDPTTGLYGLYKGNDEQKDQSYVLSVMGQFELAHTLFPIGHLPKPEVRAIAQTLNLSVHSKKDSQDLCFLGDSDYRGFLHRHVPQILAVGEIVMSTGEQVGTHNGLANYTIGQRKGLGVTASRPLYVLDKDAEHNRLIVGHEEELSHLQLTAKRVNWVSGMAPTDAFEAEIKIRYKSNSIPAWVQPLEGQRMKVYFRTPVRDVTPGQGAIIYQGSQCLGGGIIELQSSVTSNNTARTKSE